MTWNSNQSRLPYHLYTYREELRRRRRREGLLKATKTAITDQLVMNNIEEFFKFEQEEPVQIAEVDTPMELEDSAEDNIEKIYTNLDCKLSEIGDYGKTNVPDGVSSYTNINWRIVDVMKESRNEGTNPSYNFSNTTNNNEPMGMHYNYIDEICNDFDISFGDGLKHDNLKTKKNSTNCDLSGHLFLEACLNLEEFNYCINL